jgi:hypothetical protein
MPPESEIAGLETAPLGRSSRASGASAGVATLILALLWPSGVAEAQLRIQPNRVDFGKRGHNERPTETVTVENGFPVPIYVRRIVPSCSCIEVRPAGFQRPIPPGGRETLQVTMGSGRAVGVLEKHIEFFLGNQPQPAATLDVRMSVFNEFVIEPRDLRFDGVFGGPPLTGEVTIKRGARSAGAGAFTLTIEGVKDAQDASRVIEHFTAKVSDAAGGAKTIALTLKPTHPEGKIWASLEAKLDGKLLVLPVVGEVFRGIKVVPTYFNFSRISTDDPESYGEENTLSATDGRKFKILSVDPTLRDTSARGVKIICEPKGEALGTEGVEHVLVARVAPIDPVGGTEGAGPPTDAWVPKEGSFNGTVIVRTDHPDKPEVKLTFFGFFSPPKKK